MKIRKQLYITIKDIQNIDSCSYPTAHRRYVIIKDALGKKKHQKILVREYLEYEGVTSEDIGIEPC
jgi:hypothetical protein